MAHYRAYIVGSDGHFQRAEEFTSESDASALEHARQFATANNVEVWQQARRLGVIEKTSDVAA